MMGQDHFWISVHGLMMALGWLVLLPMGLWMSTMERNRCSKWLCYHTIFMSSATIVILFGALIAFLNFNEYLGFHQILGPLLNGSLVVQLAVGMMMRYCTWFQNRSDLQWVRQAHRCMGMALYLGGLVNAGLGVWIFLGVLGASRLAHAVAMSAGVVGAVHAYYISIVVPAWWQNLKDSSYSPVEGGVANDA